MKKNKDSVMSVMSVKDVAQYLRMHEMTIYRMCYKGSIPCQRDKHFWHFKKEELDQWLEEKSVGPGSSAGQ
ncbi:MAG: helix-turn-helix domain-containing protein [bacterium]|nr:helix-turn-helix domain-containing protein [bacterium]